MKAKIERGPLIDCISIIPETREELLTLHSLWSDSKIQFKKGGCGLHGDKKTHHSIINSSFAILLRDQQGKKLPILKLKKNSQPKFTQSS